jgi:hypothetical protein
VAAELMELALELVPIVERVPGRPRTLVRCEDSVRATATPYTLPAQQRFATSEGISSRGGPARSICSKVGTPSGGSSGFLRKRSIRLLGISVNISRARRGCYCRGADGLTTITFEISSTGLRSALMVMESPAFASTSRVQVMNPSFRSAM